MRDRLCLVSASSRPPRLPVPAGRWLTDARFPVPAGRWFDWCKIFSSGWPPVYWLQDRLSLVSACSRPPRLPVPASRRWTDARFPVPAGRWFDWCKIFSSDWPSVYWSQDRLSLVSACSRPPRLPVSASRWRTVARLPVPAGRWLTGLAAGRWSDCRKWGFVCFIRVNFNCCEICHESFYPSL